MNFIGISKSNPKVNNKSNPISTLSCDDNDNDGICDEDDLDDDNDGILDTDECPGLTSPSGNNGLTSATAFETILEAQEASTSGIYFFNINGTQFSTYVENGYVLLAHDYGNGTGALPQSTTLSNNARGILAPWALSALTDINEIRISQSQGFLDVSTSNATLLDKLRNNVSLNTGRDDVSFNTEWIGNGANAMNRESGRSACYDGAFLNLHENIFWPCGDPEGMHWQPGKNTQRVRFSVGENKGEMDASASFSLWVKQNNDFTCLDSDGDGTPDYLDIDSDDDGCPDALEGDGGFKESDLANGVLLGNVDANGIPISANGGQSIGSSLNPNIIAQACICNDNDNDGICDEDDLDDDNDGILDEVECPTAQVSTTFQTSGGTTTTFNAPAADKGFQFNIYRLDNSFNLNINGIDLVTDEIQCFSGFANGESLLVFESDGLTFGQGGSAQVWGINGDISNPVIQVLIDENGDVSFFGKRNTNAQLEPMKIRDDHPQPQNITWNANGTNTVVLSQKVTGPTNISGEGFGVISCSEDTDGDGILNYLDTDSDGDGCPDALEGGGGFEEADLSGEILSGAVNANGVPIVANGGQGIGSSADAGVLSENCGCLDDDNDGVCNDIDLDKDNDGILDVNECMTSDFHWSSAPQVSGKTATGVINGIGYTYTSSINIETTPTIFAYNRFPEEYNIPNTTVIKNRFQSNNTITFDQPVLNPTLMFSSIGGHNSVPIQFSNPVDVLFQSGPVTIDSPTQITGKEGYVVLRMNGTFSEISFDYLADENYVNFTFGADFATFCDTDGDGTPDYLDTDSDDDGCLDAIEGGGNFEQTDLQGDILSGTVDANGVPIIANGGQATGTSANASAQSPSCSESLCGGDINFNTWEQAGIAGEGNWVVSGDGSSVNQTINGAPTFFVGNREYLNVKFSGKMRTDFGNDDDWMGMVFGFQSPGLVANYPLTLKTYVFAWKQRNQGPWDAGFSLVEVEGTFNNFMELFEAFGTPYNKATLLASDFGTSKGYQTSRDYNISIDYSSSKIKAYVDGELIFDVDGCFDPGRIGFYNSSQPDVTYSDFTYQFIGNIDMEDDTLCLGEEFNAAVFEGPTCNNASYYPNGTIFAWDVMDGTTYSENKISHTYQDTGVYDIRLIISDGAGCEDTTFRKITISDYPTVDLGNDTTICLAASVEIDAQNVGSDFLWNTNATTQKINISNEGEYFVKVTNWAECSTNDTVNVLFDQGPEVNIGNDTTICRGQIVELDAQNDGLTFIWNTGEETQKIELDSAGTFGVEVTNLKGCIGSDSINIVINELPVVQLNNDTTICRGESVTLNAQNAGLNYSWNTNETTQTISINEAGIYGVEVRDNIGCLGSDSMELFINELPVVDLGEDQKICDGQSIELNAENEGLNFNWNNGESTQTVTLNETGTYSVEVTDEIGCLGTDEMELIVNPMPFVDLGNDTAICIGESVTLNAQNPGFNYKWNSGESSQTIVITTSGDYEVEVFDEIGCADTSNMFLDVHELPVVDLGEDQKICDGQSIELDAENEGLNFDWNNGESTQTVTLNESGTYSVEVTDEIGCLGTDEMKLIINPMPFVNLGNDTAICIGESVTLNAQNPGFNYKWNTGESSQTIVIKTTGDYEVEVFDEIGCADTSSMFLDVHELPVVQLGNDTVICEFQSVVLDAENEGLDFIWNNGSTQQTIKVSEEGLYSVEVRDDIQCLGTDEIYVTKEIIADPYSEKEKLVCEGTSIMLEPDFYNNYTIYWEENKNSSTIEVTETGAYPSYVESIYCKDTFVVNVTKIDTPDAVIIDLNGQNAYCFDLETTVLRVTTEDSGVNFEWDDFGRGDEAEITAPGTYALTAENEHCTARFEKTIEEYCQGLFFIPNAFTPGNYDGINDVFRPVTNGYIDGFDFRVYNRWGKLIYQTNIQGEGWDGTFNGNPVQIDVYTYRLSYNYISEYGGSERKVQIGNATLIR